MIKEEKLADILMYLIDSFIGLQLKAKNLPLQERYNFVVTEYRKTLADEFENNIKNHPVYLDKIRNSESGPYASTAFDINHQPNLLNI